MSTFQERIKFHEPHLERVSRSFAFGISRLEPSLRASVGLGYLICRILDTIEDARWESGRDQTRAFDEFDSFLNQPPQNSAVDAWIYRFPQDVSPGEKLLLADAGAVFREFSELEGDTRAAILKPVLSMSAGMKFFTEQTRESGKLNLKTLGEANVYCLFVAGVVGELLTGLLNVELGRDLQTHSRESFVDGCHFGLFLQKINILKDQWDDEREGRFLVPNRAEMLASVSAHADRALTYLLSIPLSRTDYRLFCAWALYLGMATVPLLEQAEGESAKLPRTQAMLLGAKIEFAIHDDEKLIALFDSLKSKQRPTTEVQILTESPVTELIGSRYQGRLSREELIRILAV